MALPEFTAELRDSATGVDDILKGKYPAKQHCEAVAKYIKDAIPGAVGVIYLESRKSKRLEDSDQEEPFRQRRSFRYLTGCDLPDCAFMYDLSRAHSTLFIPPIDPEDVIWSGLPITAEEAAALYDVDEVQLTPAVEATLATTLRAEPKATVFAVEGQFALPAFASGVAARSFGGVEAAVVDLALLKTAVDVCRVRKDAYEAALIRRANVISGAAHARVLRAVKHAENEQKLEAAFIATCLDKGARNQAYTGIFASGRAAATLHYIKNDQPLKDKQLLLLDAACEVDCYAADITRTFPISGKFTPESRAIYDIVLKMQLECIDMLREGVRWEDVHMHAHRLAAEGLLALGILKGGTAEEIVQARTTTKFFPHGLGHYLGMDTHDTGGNADYADKDDAMKYLRVRGALPSGAVITVEPGIYFCNFIIEPALTDPVHSKYIDAKVLDKYWDVGGVRIEDDVLVTATGYVNLTTVPKDPAELEGIIDGGGAALADDEDI